jgi:hypothetical protein
MKNVGTSTIKPTAVNRRQAATRPKRRAGANINLVDSNPLYQEVIATARRNGIDAGVFLGELLNKSISYRLINKAAA